MKIYLKMVILLIIFITISCTEDNENDVQKSEYPNLNFKKVSLDNIKNDNFEDYASLNMIIKKLNTNNLKRGVNNNNAYLLDTTSVGKLTDNNGFSSYTFEVISDLNEPTLQNINISNYADGTSKTLLVEYTLSENVDNINNTIEDYITTTTFYNLDNPILINSKSSPLDPFANCTQVGYYIESTHNKCESGDFSPGCVNEDGSMVQETTTTFIVLAESCSGGGGGSSSTNSGDTSSDSTTDPITGNNWGNGGNGTIPNNTIATTPIAPYINRTKAINNFLVSNNFNTNSPEHIWVDNHPILAETLGEFVISFPDNTSLSISVLHYLMNHDTLPYSGINFQLIFDFLETLNNSEATNSAEEVAEFLLDNENDPNSEIFAEEILDFLVTNGGEINFDDTLTDTLDFNSLNEFENYLDDLENLTFDLFSSIQTPNEIRRDIHKLIIRTFPAETKIVSTIRIEIPDDSNGLLHPEILYMDTQIEGSNTLYNWTQIDSGDPNDTDGPLVEVLDYDSSELQYIQVSVLGKLEIGLKIAGYQPLKITKLIKIIMYYDYYTGDFISGHWEYIN
jgi:hypothetical protein